MSNRSARALPSGPAKFVLVHRTLGTVLGPNGPSFSDIRAFFTVDSAEQAKAGLTDADQWEVRKAVYFNAAGESPEATPPPPRFQPRPGSVAAQMKVKPGEHILVCGEIQIGKLAEKHEIILTLQEQHRLPVLMLTRNNNTDYHQFSKRLGEFNREQPRQGRPPLPEPYDILIYRNRLENLLRGPNLILGLANPDTLSIVDECLKAHSELQNKLAVILDEADLVSFELEGEGLRTKTEEKMRSVFGNIYMLLSVTATPASILLSDKMTQVYTMDREYAQQGGLKYYGLDLINHVPVTPVRVSQRGGQYDPGADAANLRRVMNDALALQTATVLISVTRLRREHKQVIRWLTEEYGRTNRGVTYMELNEKAVKVYRKGDLSPTDVIDFPTTRGTKVAAIDIALEKYKQDPHIVIVAGVLAGRGVSFVSTDYERHLTHQYIADADSAHLESAMQSVRLLGKYRDDPALTLYCSQSLYRDLLAQTVDMKQFIEAAQEARANGDSLPDVLGPLQKEYDHKWLPHRKMKGTVYLEDKSDNRYRWEILEDDEKTQADYYYDAILTNVVHNYPKNLLNDVWPGGVKRTEGKEQKERVVYCNPPEDFTPEGIKAYLEERPPNLRKATRERLEKEGYPHMEWLADLYARHPEWVGKVLRRVEVEGGKVGDQFVRK